MKTVSVGSVSFGNRLPLALIAGPCQIESRGHAEMIAGGLKEIADGIGMPFVFKSSFDKANRTALQGRRGIGKQSGLSILADVKRQIGCPVLTDVHEPGQCAEAAEFVDILQIPAFLCRQTDLLLAAGAAPAAVHVKKGQFLAPWDMKFVAEKIASQGDDRILLCERGSSFGYNSLVADMRSLPVMAATGYPVVMDATHAVQQPGGRGGSSGGQREFAPVLARAAVAVGVAGVFIEVHEDPDNAPSDGPNMVRLDRIGPILETLSGLDKLAKADPVAL